jgi:hypothetical protein
MALFRIPSIRLVLLLALMLPLQSFAAAWSCGANHPGSAATQQHCAGHPDASPGGGEHHHCGTCCIAAIALLPFPWTAPRSAGSEASLPLHGPPPQVALDRLDRPPRQA